MMWVALAWALPALARPAVVVELFTSEGCSSCPAADARLLEWVEHPPVEGVDLIALSFHVDYWNALGWKDRFSSADFTARQAHYTGPDSLYTPQAILDGSYVLTSDWEGAANRLAEAAARTKLALKLGARPNSTQGAEVEIGVPQADAHLWMALTEEGLSSQVTRGENRGRTLRHPPVVRWVKDLGPSAAGVRRVQLGLPEGAQGGRVHIVAWLEAPTTHRILGASTVPWPSKQPLGNRPVGPAASALAAGPQCPLHRSEATRACL